MGFFNRLFRRKSSSDSARIGQTWGDSLDVAITTTQEIIDGKQPIVLVIHDEGIGRGWGGWQFLDGESMEEREPVAIAKEDLLKLDPTIRWVTDLPVGWCAVRDAKDSPWQRRPVRASEGGTTVELGRPDTEAELPPEARAFLDVAVDEFNRKMAALDSVWHFKDLRRWDFDVEAGRFTLELQDGTEVAADGDILGSYRPADHSWEWAWNNPDARPEARQATLAVKEFGEKHGIRYLTDGMVEVPEGEFATYLSAIAIKVLGAEGAYYGEADAITYVIALKNLTWLKR